MGVKSILNVETDLQAKVIENRNVDQQKEYKFIGSLRKMRGMKQYVFNLKTFTLKELEIKKETKVGFDKKAISSDKAIINPNEEIIIQAMNVKNANKKAIKILNKIANPNVEDDVEASEL
jgi:hypothetical protein